MRRPLAAGLAALALIAIAVPAFADPPAVILLEKTGVFGTLRRAPVSFTHQRHAGGMSCLTCHHDGDPSIQCEACHVTPRALQQAFHGQCITCHNQLKRKGPTGAPRLCGECHVWQR